MAERKDPYRQFRFRVEIDGVNRAGFSEVTFEDTTTGSMDGGENTEPPIFRKLSALTGHARITLKGGITDSMDLSRWRQQVIDSGAGAARKNISIILVGKRGMEKARWDVFRAWPGRYDHTDSGRKDNTVSIATLEIVHEGFKRVK